MLGRDLPTTDVRVYSIPVPVLFYAGKGGKGEELTRENVTGAIVHKAGRKYQHE
jgi:hypothetical protein